jgi:hypothetical protein
VSLIVIADEADTPAVEYVVRGGDVDCGHPPDAWAWGVTSASRSIGFPGADLSRLIISTVRCRAFRLVAGEFRGQWVGGVGELLLVAPARAVVIFCGAEFAFPLRVAHTVTTVSHQAQHQCGYHCGRQQD